MSWPSRQVTFSHFLPLLLPPPYMVDGCMQNKNSYCVQGEIINPPEAGLGWAGLVASQPNENKEKKRPNPLGY